MLLKDIPVSIFFLYWGKAAGSRNPMLRLTNTSRNLSTSGSANLLKDWSFDPIGSTLPGQMSTNLERACTCIQKRPNGQVC